MTILDKYDPRMRAPQRTTPDLAQYDAIIDGVLARQTEQAERFRRIEASLKTLEKNLNASISAIPLPPDLAPVLDSLRKVAADVQRAIAGIKFPTPERVDLAPVIQQIEALAGNVESVSSKVDGIPVALPDITVTAPSAPAQVVAMEAPRPRHWTFTVTRNARGFDVDAQAVD